MEKAFYVRQASNVALDEFTAEWREHALFTPEFLEWEETAPVGAEMYIGLDRRVVRWS